MGTELSIWEKVDNWTEQKKIYMVDALRILFGIFIVWKAYQFGEKPETLPLIMGRLTFLEIFLIVYVVIVQFAAGILIMVGLVTRTAILCLLPIMIGAVIYGPRIIVHLPFTNELWAVLCLLLSLGYLVYGSGVFSCDLYLRKHPPVSHI